MLCLFYGEILEDPNLCCWQRSHLPRIPLPTGFLEICAPVLLVTWCESEQVHPVPSHLPPLPEDHLRVGTTFCFLLQKHTPRLNWMIMVDLPHGDHVSGNNNQLTLKKIKIPETSGLCPFTFLICSRISSNICSQIPSMCFNKSPLLHSNPQKTECEPRVIVDIAHTPTLFLPIKYLFGLCVKCAL